MKHALVVVLAALAVFAGTGAALADDNDVRGDPPSSGGDVRIPPCSAGPC